MAKKTNLAASLAGIAGSTRKAKVVAELEPDGIYQQPSRANTRPITVHMPKEVRDQLKILAIEQDTTLHKLVAESINDLFAKYSKPEIAPV